MQPTNLQQALKVIITTSMSVDKALEDTKITPLEWAQIAIKSMQFWKVFKTIQPIYADLQNLDEQSREELNQWLIQEFDLRNDQMEQTIEKLFQILLEASKIFTSFTQKE
ncbi:MAG: hypothetical protein FD155_3471 [Bacteroidetes bacterium]|nr:MAG: hypothetical protein FD155_3471 [Bacteroidota bacterium]